MSVVARRVPLKFDHIDLNSEDPAKRVVALDFCIAQAKGWERDLQALYDDVKGDLMRVSEQHRTRPSVVAEDRINDLGRCLRQIEDGIGSMDGYVDERLAAIVSLPGLARTQEVLKELRTERTEWAARIGETERPAAKYRLKKGHTHYDVGPEGIRHVYRAGDIVELTANQAKAWADKFEPVEASEPAKKKAPLTADPDRPQGQRHTTEKELEKRARQESR